MDLRHAGIGQYRVYALAESVRECRTVDLPIPDKQPANPAFLYETMAKDAANTQLSGCDSRHGTYQRQLGEHARHLAQGTFSQNKHLIAAVQQNRRDQVEEWLHDFYDGGLPPGNISQVFVDTISVFDSVLSAIAANNRHLQEIIEKDAKFFGRLSLMESMQSMKTHHAANTEHDDGRIGGFSRRPAYRDCQ